MTSRLALSELPTLTLKERDRRWEKVREAMRKRDIECLVIWGSDGAYGAYAANLRYLSNCVQKAYLVFPAEDEPTMFIWVSGFTGPWVRDVRLGEPTFSGAISERLKELHLERARIGMVSLSGFYHEWGFPYVTYKSLIDNFPGAMFEDATDLIEELRLVKSPEEIRCFELACEAGPKIVQTFLDTATVGITDGEVRAAVRDSLFRNGCEPFSLFLYASGKEVYHCSQADPSEPFGQKVLERGDVILTEFDVRYCGYPAQYNQCFSIGPPDKEWERIFITTIESYNNGLKTLRPGITMGELHEAFLLPIKQAGYTEVIPSVHSLGLAPIESIDPSRIIEPGMVLEFQPHVVTPDKRKGASLGSPVLVTETGGRLLTKNWRDECRIIQC